MSSSRIPFYSVKGTHYEYARIVGSLTRKAIEKRIDLDQIDFSILFDFVKTDSGRKILADFSQQIRLIYPWYWDEFVGLADGSQISLERILVLNLINELRTGFHENQLANRGCSSVLINRKDTNVLSILHNEDHSFALYENGYLLEADIQSSEYDNGQRKSPKEKFLAFCCAGSIPGNAFNVNEHGFVFTINALFPDYVAFERLPRQILFRVLLTVKNQQDLDRIFQINPCAFGFSLNGGFLQQDYLVNYEIGPNRNVLNTNYISKCLILNNEQKQNDDQCSVLNYLTHYNHYERLNDVIIEQKTLESTFHRWKRGQKLGELSSINDALNLLGDNENKLFPIFRSPIDVDRSTLTLATVHINFRTLQFLVYNQNPKENTKPFFVYDLKDLLSTK